VSYQRFLCSFVAQLSNLFAIGPHKPLADITYAAGSGADPMELTGLVHRKSQIVMHDALTPVVRFIRRALREAGGSVLSHQSRRSGVALRDVSNLFLSRQLFRAALYEDSFIQWYVRPKQYSKHAVTWG